jgi:Fe2+ transport system protein FeoA
VKEMQLVEAHVGDVLVIKGSVSEEVMCQALRFGIDEGTVIKLQKKIPGGPVIISKNHLEIAIGYELASLIMVQAKTDND